MYTPLESEISSLLRETGVKFIDSGDYFSMFCPFHKNTKTSAAVLYKNTGVFNCFGCGVTLSFPKLYEKLKRTPWGGSTNFGILPHESRIQSSTKLPAEVPPVKEFAIEEGTVTPVYDNFKALAYCKSRKIEDDFMQAFNFMATTACKFKKMNGATHSTVWQDRLLIPINFNGKLYSLEGRDYTRTQMKKCLYPKWGEIDLCFNQDNLDPSLPLIVCEGIMDIHKIWSKVTKNVTCTFGVNLGKRQKSYLSGIRDIILFVDDDTAGREISVKTFENFMKYDFKVAVVPGKDPGAATELELRNALDAAVSWTDFIVNDLQIFDKSAKNSFCLI